MNIRLDDTYILTTDGMQFILEKHTTNQTEESKNFGERYVADQTYHPSINLAFRKYIKLKMVESEVATFSELVDVVNKAHEDIDRAIKEIKQDMKAVMKL